MAESAPNHRRVKYAAVVDNVQEVSLLGRAEIGFWRRRLAAEGLFPLMREGAAEIVLSATRLRWMGWRFREFTCAVAVTATEGGSSLDGYYLVHAYNSSGWLAWMERTFFATPYYRGGVEVELEPASFRLTDESGGGLEGVRGKGAIGLAREVIDDFFGPIYLPTLGRAYSGRPGDGGKMFFGQLCGPLEVYAFDADCDRLVISPPVGEHFPTSLRDSRFQPYEWRIRRSARHAKSKTYRRDL